LLAVSVPVTAVLVVVKVSIVPEAEVSCEIVPEAEVRSAMFAEEMVVVARVEVPVTVSELVTVTSCAVSDVMNAVTELRSVAKKLVDVALSNAALVA